MKLTVKTTTTTETEVEVSFPSFYKTSNKYFGFFDESEVIRIWDAASFTSIDSFGTDCFQSDINEAIAKGEQIEELEFRLAYENAIKKVSLPRRQLTTADFEGD